MNVADFVDANIDEKLAALERDEELLLTETADIDPSMFLPPEEQEVHDEIVNAQASFGMSACQEGDHNNQYNLRTRGRSRTCWRSTSRTWASTRRRPRRRPRASRRGTAAGRQARRAAGRSRSWTRREMMRARIELQLVAAPSWLRRSRPCRRAPSPEPSPGDLKVRETP